MLHRDMPGTRDRAIFLNNRLKTGDITEEEYLKILESDAMLHDELHEEQLLRDAALEATEASVEASVATPRFRREMRKAITGNESTRLRDHISDLFQRLSPGAREEDTEADPEAQSSWPDGAVKSSAEMFREEVAVRSRSNTEDASPFSEEYTERKQVISKYAEEEEALKAQLAALESLARTSSLEITRSRTSSWESDCPGSPIGARNSMCSENSFGTAAGASLTGSLESPPHSAVYHRQDAPELDKGPVQTTPDAEEEAYVKRARQRVERREAEMQRLARVLTVPPADNTSSPETVTS